MNRRIIYTDVAKERLNELHAKIDRDIEEYFEDKKFVPGDDFIEITGSDIDYMSKRIKVSEPTPQGSYARQVVFFLYFVTGLLCITGGIYFDDIQKLLTGDPRRLILIGGGTLMITMSFIFQFYFKKRNYRKQLTEKRIIEDKIDQMMKDGY